MEVCLFVNSLLLIWKNKPVDNIFLLYFAKPFCSHYSCFSWRILLHLESKNLKRWFIRFFKLFEGVSMCTTVGNEMKLSSASFLFFFFFFCWNECVILCLFLLKNLLNLCFIEQRSSNQIQAPSGFFIQVYLSGPLSEPARPLRICILTSVHLLVLCASLCSGF